MNNLKIEKLKLDEVNYIKKIETNQNINIISKNNILEDLKTNKILYYTLKFKNKIIGYIAFDTVLENMDIQSIVISKEFQRMGYGTVLLEFAFDYAIKNNIFNIFLEVRKSNIQAINLYEKNGFKFINIRKRYYPDNFEDALIYLKTI